MQTYVFVSSILCLVTVKVIVDSLIQNSTIFNFPLFSIGLNPKHAIRTLHYTTHYRSIEQLMWTTYLYDRWSFPYSSHFIGWLDTFVGHTVRFLLFVDTLTVFPWSCWCFSLYMKCCSVTSLVNSSVLQSQAHRLWSGHRRTFVKRTILFCRCVNVLFSWVLFRSPSNCSRSSR